MDIFYDISITNEQGRHTCRLPLRALRFLFLNMVSNFAIDGIIVNALNHITFDPISDVTVNEICNFFSALCQDFLDWQVANNPGVVLRVGFGVPQRMRKY